MSRSGASLRSWLRHVAPGLRRWRLRRREHAAVARSAAFDRGWYRATYADAGKGEAVRHYLRVRDGRRPSPWFDAAWYRDRYPDVIASGLDPLAHYVLYGAAEGRDPNRVFATRWYLDCHPEAAAAASPLDHYVREGARLGHDPSPELDAAWYGATQVRAGEAAPDPLAHYLLVGAPAGRAPKPGVSEAPGPPVEAARLQAFKPVRAAPGATFVLVAAKTPGGVLPTPAVALVEALAGAGVEVALLVETEAPFSPDPDLVARLAGGYVREPLGDWPAAAAAHLLRGEPLLFSGQALCLVDADLAAEGAQAVVALVDQARRGAAEVGALAREAGGRRLDSRFLALKGRGLVHPLVHGVLAAVTAGEARGAFDARLAAAVGRAGLRLAFLDAAPPEPVSASRTEPETPGPLLAPGADPGPQPPYKVAFIGPWTYASGLALASRGCLTALWRTPWRLNLLPIAAPFHTHARLAPSLATRDFAGAADVVIVHLNPDSWGLLSDEQRRTIDQARVRIGLWVWEMGQVPPAWQANFEAVDEIWTPSRYCAQVFAAQTRRPVSVVPHVVPVPPPAAPGDRTAVLQGLGLAPDARLLLYAFDGASYLARKNPGALLRAFAAAGLAARGWRLALKTKNLADQPREEAALRRILERTPGALLIDQPYGQEALSVLFEACDLYVSPHRSEGFGLTVAEAMALGKPVVATAFGGVCDFLDESCGYPVAARTMRLEQDLGAYGRGGTWGDFDDAALAQALTEAARAVEAGDETIGRRARARIAERLSPEAVAEAMWTALDGAFARLAARSRAA
jgi:hypothetical protein